MFDFTARNFTGALCDPDNLPVTKFSAKNSLYEIIDKEIITSEMIQELIKQTQNTETRIILHDDNQKVKTLSQPLTSLFSLLEPDQIQSDGQNRCLFYPFCKEKFRNFTESVIHTYFHCNNHPKEINKFKIFLPHELLIYMNLYEKFEMFIPNLVNTILPLHTHTHTHTITCYMGYAHYAFHGDINENDKRKIFTKILTNNNKLNISKVN